MVLFTDIDNTVIYSHRHFMPDSKVWVEELNNHKQSYMTERSYTFYKQQKWLDVIPVTTRTPIQYTRLKDAFFELGWNEALICNGAIRVVEGVEDPDWTKESLHIISSSIVPFKKAYELAVNTWGIDKIVLIEPFMFYIKTDDTEHAYAFISDRTDRTELFIGKDSRKVYCMHALLTKGNAVERYKKRFSVKACIAAGDSEFDISMLRQANIGFYPQNLLQANGNNIKMLSQGRFSDEICNELENIKKEGTLCD